MYVDVYASQHGCEEFYYSNVPSEDAEKLGLCGGGTYREIQVYIDDVLAGIVLPFPTIYTGGINPLAWRPITGIQSFDIISHKVDITPFTGMMMEGEHMVSLKVIGNNNEGYWFVDSSLIIQRNPLNYIESCSITSYENKGPSILLDRNFNTPNNYIYNTNGSHELFISSSIKYSNDGVKTYSVSNTIEVCNINDLIGTTSDYTIQSAKSKTISSVDENQIVQEVSYPLYVYSFYDQNNDTFDMSADIKYGYERVNSYITDGNEFSISISNNIITNATYNRSTIDQSLVYKQADSSVEDYIIISNKAICYKSFCKANDGYIENNAQSEMCKIPNRLQVCGYDICGTYHMNINDLSTHLTDLKVSILKLDNFREKGSYTKLQSADIENTYRSYNKLK